MRTLLILTFIYPFFYLVPSVISIGYTFSKYYFAILSCLWILFYFTKLIGRNFRERLSDKVFKLSLLCLFFYAILFHASTDIFNILLYILFILTFYLSIEYYKPKYLANATRKYSIFFVGISVVLLFFESRYGNYHRFNGPVLTGTVFSTYLIGFLLLLRQTTESRKAFIVAYIICFALVFLSGTRTSTIFLIVLPFLDGAFSKYRGIGAFISLIIVLNLIYPIYELLLSVGDFFLTTNRYGSGKDYSFMTRSNILNTLFDQVNSQNIIELMFGNGPKFTRELIIQEFGVDMMAHNDFITILLDYGLIGFLLIFIFLFQLFTKSRTTALMITLFLLSFSHNMFYDRFMMFLILLSFYLSSLRLMERKKESSICLGPS